MSDIDAVYRHGVFEPLQPVDLQEDQRVRLSVVAAGGETPQAWLKQVRELQAAIVARGGPLPDSAGYRRGSDSMSDIVVDSSVVAKWILPEADSPQAQQLIAKAASDGSRLIVLDLVFPEVANAIWKRHRQRLITLGEAKASLAMLHGLPVRIEPATPLLDVAFDIAAGYDRSVYDALFVALAQSLGVQGVTADGPLFNTVGKDFPQIVLLRDLR